MKKTLTALAYGAFPPGTNWTEGETRTVELKKGTKIPEWLSEDKPKAPKAKAKTEEEG